MDYKILKADVPNSNGRIYTIDVIKKIMFDKPKGLGMIDNTSSFLKEIPLNLVSHKFELKVEDDYLVASIQPLDTPEGVQLKNLIEKDKVAFRTVGMGTISDANIISDYTLVSINAYCKEDVALLD